MLMLTSDARIAVLLSVPRIVSVGTVFSQLIAFGFNLTPDMSYLAS